MKLSAAEYEIMECVWALGRPVSGMDIMRALGQEKGWSTHFPAKYFSTPISSMHFLPMRVEAEDRET